MYIFIINLLGEKKKLNDISKNPLIKYPLKKKVKDLDDKIYLLVQCFIGRVGNKYVLFFALFFGMNTVMFIFGVVFLLIYRQHQLQE